MDFLITATQYTHVGYPLIFFYLIALVGIVLAVFRPYWAFLFALFCLAARNFHAAVFTRPPIFGPYLNLNDLLLWIALFAMIFEILRTRKMIWMPKILFAIFVLVFIGDIQSLFKYGTEEHVLRRIWSTAIFPILFLVSANMVKNEERAKLFYWALFWGAVVAAIQHMYFIWNVSYHGMAGEAQIRTISYGYSGGLYLVIAAIFIKKEKGMNRLQSIIYFAGIALIGLSYVLNLTRGVYVIAIASLLVLAFLLKREYKAHKTVYNIVLTSILAIFIVSIIFPNLDVKTILNKRFESFIYKDTFEKAYDTRKMGTRTELELWMNGTIIFGEGSSLPPEHESAEPEITGALYHVGYSTYLVHYGLAGLAIYAILLPIMSIAIARRLYGKHLTDYRGRIALIAMTCALFDIFSLPTSHHHILPLSHIIGLIYGAMWGVYRAGKLEERAEAFHKYRHPSFVPSSSFEKYGK